MSSSNPKEFFTDAKVTVEYNEDTEAGKHIQHRDLQNAEPTRKESKEGTGISQALKRVCSSLKDSIQAAHVAQAKKDAIRNSIRQARELAAVEVIMATRKEQARRKQARGARA